MFTQIGSKLRFLTKDYRGHMGRYFPADGWSQSPECWNIEVFLYSSGHVVLEFNNQDEYTEAIKKLESIEHVSPLPHSKYKRPRYKALRTWR